MLTKKMMLPTAVAVGALFGIGAASAADLAVKARPYAAPAPAFTWTGCYIGAHAGAGVLLDQGFQDPFFRGKLLNPVTPGDRHGFGGVAGGQIGCNYQTGMLVLGIEGEGFWSGMRVNADTFQGTTLVQSTAIRNKWDYDIAARIGVAFDRALFYGKAGWVAGRFDWSTSNIFNEPTTRGDATLDGLLIGVGLEYAFLPNWTTKFEYDYLGFGAKNVNFTSVCCGPAPTQSIVQTQNVSADKHIFKVGVNYKFF